MENDNCLDLSLSLPCGGPSTDIKGNNGIGVETRAEEADRGSKLINDFKNFLDGGTQKEDLFAGSQRSSQSKPEENLFYDLSKAPANVDASNVNMGRFWGKSDGDMRHEASGKRKNLFDETNHQKWHERDAHLADLHDKTRSTTDEGSTAENEDVADSEVDGSTSKPVGNVGLSDGKKEVRGPVLGEKEFRVGNVSYGVPFSGQPVNVLNMPYPLSVNESNSNPACGTPTPGYTLPNMGQLRATASNDKSGTLAQQSAVPANLPLMFGYSPLNMPTAEPAPKPFEKPKGDGKHANEEGSSSHTEGTVGTPTAKTTGDQGCTPGHQVIRSGLAADLKFGGSGSSPNLPWVSTRGPGPNGKTISGVTYRHSGTHIRIVCACHGSHMSPEEFVQHANQEEPPPNPGSGVASFPSNNHPAASAQS